MFRWVGIIPSDTFSPTGQQPPDIRPHPTGHQGRAQKHVVITQNHRFFEQNESISTQTQPTERTKSRSHIHKTSTWLQARSAPRRATSERRRWAPYRPPTGASSCGRPGPHLLCHVRHPKRLRGPIATRETDESRTASDSPAGRRRRHPCGCREQTHRTRHPVIPSGGTPLSTLRHARRAGKPLARPGPQAVEPSEPWSCGFASPPAPRVPRLHRALLWWGCT